VEMRVRLLNTRLRVPQRTQWKKYANFAELAHSRGKDHGELVNINVGTVR
jgi:hypothetical protein